MAFVILVFNKKKRFQKIDDLEEKKEFILDIIYLVCLFPSDPIPLVTPVVN